MDELSKRVKKIEVLLLGLLVALLVEQVVVTFFNAYDLICKYLVFNMLDQTSLIYTLSFTLGTVAMILAVIKWLRMD